MKTFNSADEMERVFEAGEESVLDYADMPTLRKPGRSRRQTALSLPEWLISTLDDEASRIGVSRQVVIKTWLAERADRERAAKA